jgi:hypothetical protein
MNNQLPQAVKACLWSYDVTKIDLANTDHRKLIIKNVLDRGTSEAVDWLLTTFQKKEIAETIEQTHASDWNRKSLSLWNLVFNTRPLKTGRFA